MAERSDGAQPAALQVGISGPADPSSTLALTADNVVFSAD